ncbi:CoxG family protein [Micromonospora sp. U21]|uniref:CoxG family protein n=1 Tax=Micromonospora sp. U21 TaxID=2824899 RepID=UPI001B377C35|nr:SRPBCC domain-containing protein [Micromonospora sp. U21]MBQ0904996.1 hypothetical protein [Micromonospora sp. U21]
MPVDSERVFELFLDQATMAACIPGCEELVRVDERHYSGRLVNEIAHVRFNASFSAEIVELDPPREVRAVLKGEDRRLGSSLRLDAVLGVLPNGNGSEVSYRMEMALWGKLGRMGESIFRRRTAEVEKQFVEKFTQICTGVPIDEVRAGGMAKAAPSTGAAPAAASAAEAGGVAQPVAVVETPLAKQQVPVKKPALVGAVLAFVAWLLGRRSTRSGK